MPLFRGFAGYFDHCLGMDVDGPCIFISRAPAAPCFAHYSALIDRVMYESKTTSTCLHPSLPNGAVMIPCMVASSPKVETPPDFTICTNDMASKMYAVAIYSPSAGSLACTCTSVPFQRGAHFLCFSEGYHLSELKSMEQWIAQRLGSL